MKKKRSGTVATTEEAEFQTLFERECALLICCTSVETAPSIWYIDSGASSHMIGVREHLTDLRDTEVRMEIALGDDTLVRVVGIGTITFQRDSMPPISFRDVLYVLGLKKNLISFLPSRIEVLRWLSEALRYSFILMGLRLSQDKWLEWGMGNCSDCFFNLFMHWQWATTTTDRCVSYGIVGWPTYIMELLKDWERLWPECHRSVQSIKMFAEGVCLVSLPRPRSLAVTPGQPGYWI
jgi:hypothetical protein